MTVVSMNYLLEAGVHFGHQKRRWNPKMREFIYTARDDIHIIDLQKTAKKIEEAYELVRDIAQNGGTFLFVGTKKQAQEAVEESATRTKMFFINERWLGGTLTNFRTIRSRINRLFEIEEMEKEGIFEKLPKKEVLQIKKEYEKLNRNLRGIREMKKVPNALIIVDPRSEETAIKEARKLNIPVFGIVDTNCDPDMVDYVIPANDDAIRSVKLIIGVLANAVAEVTGCEMVRYISPEDEKRANDRREAKEQKAPREEVKKEVVEEIAPKEEINEPVIKEEVKVEEIEIKEEIKKPTTKKVVKEEKVSFDDMTLAELKAIAKEKGIKGYSTMKKAEIINNIK